MNVAADDFCQKGMSGARAACEEYAAPCMSDSGGSDLVYTLLQRLFFVELQQYGPFVP